MRKSLIAISVAAIVMAGACADDPETGEDTQSLREITFLIPFPGATSYPPPYLAQELGYFAEEGLDVVVEAADGSGAVVQQLAAGNVVVGDAGIGSLAQAAGEGQDLVSVYVKTHRTPFELVTLADSEFQAVSDLEGAQIGLASATGGEVPVLRAALAENGIDPDTDVELVAVGDAGPAAVALERGRIAAYMSDKFSMIEVKDQLDVRSLDLADLENYPADVLVFDRDTVENDPDLVVGIGRAHAKAAEFSFANPEATMAILQELVPDQITDPEGLDMTFLELQMSIDEPPAEVNGQWGAAAPGVIAAYMEFLLEQGELNEEVNPEEVYTDEFVEEFNDFDKDAIRQEAADYDG